MSLRAPKQIIESLRLILQRLEQTVDPTQDPEARAELKRILLLRIATLEAIEALRAGAAARKASEPVSDARPTPLPSRAMPQPLPSSEVTAPVLDDRPVSAGSPN